MLNHVVLHCENDKFIVEITGHTSFWSVLFLLSNRKNPIITKGHKIFIYNGSAGYGFLSNDVAPVIDIMPYNKIDKSINH